MKKYILLLSAFSLVAFASCTNDDDDHDHDHDDHDHAAIVVASSNNLA